MVGEFGSLRWHWCDRLQPGGLPLREGTGLGLSQIFGFIKQDAGHVKIYSEVGQGTTAKIYLRRYYGASEAANHDVSEASVLLGNREVVLLVEDDEGMQQVAKTSLEELGYIVLAPRTSEKALEIIKSDRRIDVLFTDVVMPGLNGRQLADRACTMRPGLKVLFASSYTRNAIVHNGVLDPGVLLLMKPYTLEQLSRALRDALKADR